ncbi:MAG: type II toxin-antitoxin system VapB family antitoxin [Balneolaceae bacterium]|nr:type II toxin-antitoxin system VapB family antitoxin [Balneolaceae bacterium]
MRTNIVIDDDLMNEVLSMSKFKTKKDAVEAGLKLLLQRKKQEQIRELRGKLRWEGDLEDMRRDDK